MRLALPWFALAFFAIGSAALTTYSRVNWRPNQALESRYASVSLYFYLALIVVALLVAREARRRGSLRMAYLTNGLIVAIVLLAVIGWFSGVTEMARLRRERLIGLAAVEFSRVVDTTYFLRGYLRMAPGFAPSPVETIATAERLGLLRYPVRTSAVLETQTDVSAPSPEFGRVDGLAVHDRSVEMHGWAVLPQLGLPSPVVAIAYRADDHWSAVALAEVGKPREDVSHLFRSTSYRLSGWQAAIDRRLLPAQAETLSAWAVDPLANSARILVDDNPIR